MSTQIEPSQRVAEKATNVGDHDEVGLNRDRFAALRLDARDHAMSLIGAAGIVDDHLRAIGGETLSNRTPDST